MMTEEKSNAAAKSWNERGKIGEPGAGDACLDLHKMNDSKFY